MAIVELHHVICISGCGLSGTLKGCCNFPDQTTSYFLLMDMSKIIEKPKESHEWRVYMLKHLADCTELTGSNSNKHSLQLW